MVLSLSKKTMKLEGLHISYSSTDDEQAGEAAAGEQEKREAVVLLHGWGGSVESMWPIYQYLAPNYAVYALDFPGFGASDAPPLAWGVGDYLRLLLAWLGALQIQRATFLGHSFGGRVSIMLAAKHPERVRRLILVDSAGIRPKRTARYYTRTYFYKVAKRVIALPGIRRWQPQLRKRLLKLLGAEDYGNTTPGPMQGTFIRVVNEDLRPLLKQIKAPSLLIWGSEDQDTPLGDGKIMEQEIPDAGLVVFQGAGHFSYLDCFTQFCAVISSFLKS
jgi:pimeloyl-ACP methyl ester carboxylesterase